MQKNTKEKLISFFNSSTWSSGHELDDKKFFDFIVEAYVNNDRGFNIDDLELVAREVFVDKIPGNLREELSRLESLYMDGISILKKYDNIKKSY